MRFAGGTRTLLLASAALAMLPLGGCATSSYAQDGPYQPGYDQGGEYTSGYDTAPLVDYEQGYQQNYDQGYDQAYSDYAPQPVASVDMFYGQLASYGRWTVVPRYGRVWLPSVARDWRPYTVGRWRYTSNYGYFWDSQEPWGWATYHYGRWGFDPTFGWMWVPGTEWAPAWVSWRYGGGYAGWAPIPPGVSISFGLGGGGDYWGGYRNAWVFAPSSALFAPRVYSYAVPYYRNAGFFRSTRFVNNVTVINNRYINRGIDFDEVRRHARDPIPYGRLEGRGYRPAFRTVDARQDFGRRFDDRRFESHRQDSYQRYPQGDQNRPDGRPFVAGRDGQPYGLNRPLDGSDDPRRAEEQARQRIARARFEQQRGVQQRRDAEARQRFEAQRGVQQQRDAENRARFEQQRAVQQQREVDQRARFEQQRAVLQQREVDQRARFEQHNVLQQQRDADIRQRLEGQRDVQQQRATEARARFEQQRAPAQFGGGQPGFARPNIVNAPPQPVQRSASPVQARQPDRPAPAARSAERPLRQNRDERQP